MGKARRSVRTCFKARSGPVELIISLEAVSLPVTYLYETNLSLHVNIRLNDCSILNFSSVSDHLMRKPIFKIRTRIRDSSV